jgi:SAM-dependent methyltransferase
MRSSAVRDLFRRSAPRPAGRALPTPGPGEPAQASQSDPPPPRASLLQAAAGATEAAANAPGPPLQTAWPQARLTLARRLWGPGFTFPGGEIEALRLARPLGLSPAVSLLIVNVGAGGAASAISRNLGVWVTGLEADPALLSAGQGLITRTEQKRKVTLAAWDPSHPAIEPRSHHHCLALEALQHPRPEPILDALARALKPGGQMVLTELTSPEPLNANDPTVRRWAELEGRDPAQLLAPVAITRMLGRLGLDVRVGEDTSQRHLEQAMLGWRVLLNELDAKPSRHEAAQMVREAELWLLRRRLIRDGRLRMMRWHAISHAPLA